MTGTEMTDANTLNRVYWRAVAKSERESGPTRAIGDGHTAGLRAVAEAADRAAVRRTLDEIGVLVDNDDRHALVDYIVKTREGLDRGE